MTRLPAKIDKREAQAEGRLLAARVWALRVLPLIAGLLLLWFVFRDVPLSEIRRTLGLVRPWQLGVVLVVNVLFHVFMGMRWWLLARTDIGGVRLTEMVLIRLGAFGVSYITPGPQLGGEPLQVLFLRRRHAASFPRASATVLMDRLVELLAGFIFLVVGITALLRERLIEAVVSFSPWLLAPLALVMAWPVAHIFLLWRGIYPVSAVLARVSAPARLRKVWRLSRAAEHLAGRFCERRPGAVLAAVGASLLAGLLAVLEYALITVFLGMQLTAWQVLAGWTAGWLSFLVPLPGALGAMEASQVIALGSFGVARPVALSLAILLRLRDLLFGGAGFLLATRQVEQVLGPTGQSKAE